MQPVVCGKTASASLAGSANFKRLNHETHELHEMPDGKVAALCAPFVYSVCFVVERNLTAMPILKVFGVAPLRSSVPISTLGVLSA